MRNRKERGGCVLCEGSSSTIEDTELGDEARDKDLGYLPVVQLRAKWMNVREGVTELGKQSNTGSGRMVSEKKQAQT